MAETKFSPNQIDTVALAADGDMQSGLIGPTNLYALDDTTISSAVDGEILMYNSTTSKWENTAHVTGVNSYYIDVTTGVGSPLGMLDTALPTGWTTTYQAIGQFVLTHTLGISTPGFALSVIYNGAARILNPTSVTTNTIIFQITDATGTAVEGNVAGKLLF